MAIVASPTAQDTAIANFKAWNVTSVYGSYSSQMDTDPASVRAWNAKLAANGIRSYFLISSATFFLPDQWTNAQAWITKYVINFNAASSAAQSFTGVAFDVEPQSFTGNTTWPSWGAATRAQRRVYATYLVNMLTSARALLKSNGAGSLPIESYLSHSYISLTSTIQWTDGSDRDAWFASLAAVCDTISVDQYGTNSISSIVSGFQANNALLSNKARVALSTDGTDWASTSAFFTGAAAVEAQTGTFVDIEDYDTTAK
ncbi:hypothetical protein ACFQBQ_06945 [Granulicella cerasi]|uniref:Uncharacterized protein n=1 Tax=Granulicella cerasi TaxID=741063 RepID=A0ABW1Z787_9BACT|nr:hypothetical protein [Granulicella cerasi]